VKKLILVLCLFNVSYGLVTISPSLSVLSAQSPQAQITVLNRGNERAYVSMETEQYSCTDKNDSVLCSNQTQLKDKSLEGKIRFSNSKFLLDPGQKRNIFIFWSGGLPENVTNVNVWALDNAPSATTVVKQKINKSSFQLNVKTVQKVKVMVAPKNTKNIPPTSNISGNQLTVRNTGTAPLLLRYNESCANGKCQDNRIASLPKVIEGNGSKSIRVYADRSLMVQYFDYQRQSWQEVYRSSNN